MVLVGLLAVFHVSSHGLIGDEDSSPGLEGQQIPAFDLTVKRAAADGYLPSDDSQGFGWCEQQNGALHVWAGPGRRRRGLSACRARSASRPCLRF